MTIAWTRRELLIAALLVAAIAAAVAVVTPRQHRAVSVKVTQLNERVEQQSPPASTRLAIRTNPAIQRAGPPDPVALQTASEAAQGAAQAAAAIAAANARE